MDLSPGIYYRANESKEPSESERKPPPKRVISKEIEEAVIRVNRKAVYRILKEHGLLQEIERRRKEIEARYRRKLSELLPKGPNELWQMDVTYVYISGYGFLFQIDVQDYFSKYVLVQRICYSYSAKEGVAALKDAIAEAERLHGPLTKTIHLITDNGTTFIAKFWAEKLRNTKLSEKEERLFDHIRIGYRMPQHIGSIERFHGNFKRECVHLHWFQDPIEAEICAKSYGRYYNYERPHWTLKLKTPAEVYLNRPYEETLSFKPTDDILEYRDLCFPPEVADAA